MRARRLNRNKKIAISDGRLVPDANEEYLLYQTLVGVWPWQLEPENRDEIIRRVQDYMTKAVHEAKVNLSWVNQNPEYVEALCKFVGSILSERPRANSFVALLEEFLKPITYFGAINSLAQLTLKLTSPGNPDFYQGTELWDFSLVDPDNRRPVDFAVRKQMIANLRMANTDPLRSCIELQETYQDGRIKMWISMRGMEFRREHAALFHKGNYIPLESSDFNQHVCAFARVLEEKSGKQMAVVAAPRFTYTLLEGKPLPPVGPIWGEATIKLPQDSPDQFENIFTGERVQSQNGVLLCRDLFKSFPVCLLRAVEKM
jgi:(1->4)-alpha-D-glucan 1-alpha-D-glucosylmutase